MTFPIGHSLHSKGVLCASVGPDRSLSFEGHDDKASLLMLLLLLLLWLLMLFAGSLTQPRP
jgi:hypothetical protein